MTRTTLAYPGAPVPPRSRWKARMLGLAACVALGAAIGWRLGK